MNARNQMCQRNLQLGSKWATQDPYVRIFTTFVGTTATDAWFLSKRRKVGPPISIAAFADQAAFSLFETSEQVDKEDTNERHTRTRRAEMEVEMEASEYELVRKDILTRSAALREK